jgi:two-component system response regulator CpxR
MLETIPRAERPIKKAATPTQPSVLVVDDDVELCHLLSQYLTHEGFAVEFVHTGAKGVERTLSGQHAVIILDVMLPEMKGFEVLRRIRAQSRTPVLMLTARGDDQDRILGLEMGADDYLPKPFNPRELSARLTAILRRSGADRPELSGSERLALEDVELDKGARTVRRGGEKVDLTTVEFDLLETFIRSAGAVLSREEIVRTVLGREFTPFDRSMDTHVCNLRRKLGPRADGLERIKGVRSIGYLYVFSATTRAGQR